MSNSCRSWVNPVTLCSKLFKSAQVITSSCQDCTTTSIQRRTGIPASGWIESGPRSTWSVSCPESLHADFGVSLYITVNVIRFASSFAVCLVWMRTAMRMALISGQLVSWSHNVIHIIYIYTYIYIYDRYVYIYIYTSFQYSNITFICSLIL